MSSPHLENTVWFGYIMDFLGALGGVVGFVIFGYFGSMLWRVALDHRQYSAFFVSSSFWIIAIGLLVCDVLIFSEMLHWIRSSVVTAIGDPVVHIGFPVAGGLLMLGFAIFAFGTDKLSRKP